jgi:hypothetical protein
MKVESLIRAKVSAGSACLLAAVPEEWVSTIPAADPASGTITADIILKPGYKWLRAILVSRTRFFKEDTMRTDAGKCWAQSISGKSCGQSPTLHHLLSMWTDHRWVLLYKEVGTGATYLIGKPGSGAIANVQYSNEGATVSTVTFTRTAINRAYHYGGSFQLDNNVSISKNDNVQSHFYRHGGADATELTFPSLSGKTLISVSRSGIKDLEIILTPGTPLTLDNQIYFNSSNGFIKLCEEYPLAYKETLQFLYK